LLLPFSPKDILSYHARAIWMIYDCRIQAHTN